MLHRKVAGYSVDGWGMLDVCSDRQKGSKFAERGYRGKEGCYGKID
jgi:hypothetical protein